jgi:hypothetical protein
MSGRICFKHIYQRQDHISFHLLAVARAREGLAFVGETL